MSTPLFFGRDKQGMNAYAPRPSTNIFSATLTNGTPQTITLPTNVKEWVVAFSVQPGNDIWVDFTGSAAALPIGATFASTTSELNPGSRMTSAFKKDGVTAATISVITPNTNTEVSVALYIPDQTSR